MTSSSHFKLSPTRLRVASHLAIALSLMFAAAGCGRGNAQTTPAAAPLAASDGAVEVAPEDLLVLQREQSASATVITGTVQPERRADLRAETAAVVVQVVRENGEAVKKGELLVRQDDAAIRDNVASASAAVRVAAQALEQTERQLQRLKRLRGMGLAALQEVVEVESRRSSAQGELAAASARVAQARQQLQRTEVRAPFDGIISDRKVSPGDTAQIGKELVKVLDPRSMRLEGLVSADRAGSVRVGQVVRFRVNGDAGHEFVGHVRRIDPAASAATRQVAMLVDFEHPGAAPVAGLYAEGLIDSGASAALSINASALVHEDGRVYAWRVRDGVLRKSALTLGVLDERHGRYPVRAGLDAGDTVIRRPGAGLAEGRKVRMAAPLRA
jgi:RND family efflux transporter MFP subunit